jgi:hypothetical protein
MGSLDGAEICELVGLFILNHLGKRFGKENIGLYRDDGLAIMKSKSACLLGKTRKELHKIFDKFDLKITAEVKLNVVNFLDVTFDLINANTGNHTGNPMMIHCTSTDTQTIHQALQDNYLRLSTNALHFSHRTNKHLRNLRLFTRTLLDIVTLIMNLRTLRTHRNRHIGIGNAT